MSFSRFLARRYLASTKGEKNIATVALLCFISIFIGSFSLALVISVMQGFEQVTHKQLQGVHAHLIIRGHNHQQLAVDKITQVIEKEFPEIIGTSPTLFSQCSIKTINNDMSGVVMVKAVDPLAESKTSLIEQKIIQKHHPDKRLENLLHNNSIIIGNKLAQELEIAIGDTIQLVFSPEEATGRTINLEQHAAQVTGIFKTGVDEFDNGVLYCSLSFAQRLWPENTITQINVQCSSNSNIETIKENLKERFGLSVYSWKDLYPAIVAALKLEKWAMFLILVLITLVASMNIISLEFMLINNKKRDIAILKAMGAQNKVITKTFLNTGLGIALLATCAGLTCAFIAGLLLQRFPIITLPDIYYTNHLPIALSPTLFAVIFGVVMLLSFLATWLPVNRAGTIAIAKTLKFEG